jgi:hypothetical protein
MNNKKNSRKIIGWNSNRNWIEETIRNPYLKYESNFTIQENCCSGNIKMEKNILDIQKLTRRNFSHLFVLECGAAKP